MPPNKASVNVRLGLDSSERLFRGLGWEHRGVDPALSFLVPSSVTNVRSTGSVITKYQLSRLASPDALTDHYVDRQLEQFSRLTKALDLFIIYVPQHKKISPCICYHRQS